jgi:hypothetical protein
MNGKIYKIFSATRLLALPRMHLIISLMHWERNKRKERCYLIRA